MACCRDLDQTNEGLACLAQGEALGVRAADVQVELLGQGAALLIHVGNAPRARAYIDRSLDLVEAELSKPERATWWAKARRRWFTKAKARNLVLRGDLTLRLGDRPGREALRDAFEAIEVAKGFVYEQANGVSLVSQLLVYHGGLPEVIFVLKITKEFDRFLARTKRFPRNHPQRLFVRWGRAIAFARLGMDERAESTITEVIEELVKLGMRADAKMAAEALVWMIGERSGELGRARCVAMKYQTVLPELKPPNTPAPVADGPVRGW